MRRAAIVAMAFSATVLRLFLATKLIAVVKTLELLQDSLERAAV